MATKVATYAANQCAARLSVPVGHRSATPFVSSVDHGWLALGLLPVGHAVPALHGPVDVLVRSMDWRVFWDAEAGLMRDRVSSERFRAG